ncbi:MAG: glycosyltransferase family 2 protein, partial [Verrucomicrobiota bacterium]|nr:glycosyltransferase family 2 protein [Verrucomicrobiota bacterium]
MRDLTSKEKAQTDAGNPSSTTPVTLSVIFPAFNEEANIRYTVEAARMVLPKLAQTWEIIL